MARVKSQIIGMDILEKKVNRLSKAAHKEMAVAAVTAGAGIIKTEAQKNARDVFSQNQTGALRNSISIEVEDKGGGAVATVGPSVIYGRIQELGGTIKARGGLLRFQIDGHWVQTKQVTLPPRPYLGPAVEENWDPITEAIINEIKKAVGDAVEVPVE